MKRAIQDAIRLGIGMSDYGEDQFKNRPQYKVHIAIPRGLHKEQSKSWTLRVSRIDGLPIHESEINGVCEIIVEMSAE